MTEVRKHKRQTASGRVTNVRRHTRRTGGGAGGSEQERPAFDAGRRAPSVGSGALAHTAPPRRESWWDDDGEPAGDFWAEEEVPSPADREFAAMQAQMREWRARPVPQLPPEEMSPQMATLMGCDTLEGRERFERGRAYRETGYTGPLDGDNRIPDPDDPVNRESLHALAAMRVSRG